METDELDGVCFSGQPNEDARSRVEEPTRSAEYVRGKSDGVREGLSLALTLIQRVLDGEAPKPSVDMYIAGKPLCRNVREANPGKEHHDMHISDAGFSTRAFNILWREGIYSVGDIPVVNGPRGEKSLTDFRNFGKACIANVRETLSKLGLDLPHYPTLIE